MSLVSAVGVIVVVEDLLSVDLTLGEVHCILTHGQCVTDRRTDFVGLDEQCTSREAVAGFGVAQSCVISNTGERDLTEVAGDVSVSVAVESDRSVGVDSEDVVRSVVVVSKSNSAAA